MNLVNTQFDPSERVPGELDYLGYDGSSLNFCFDDVIEGIRSLDGEVRCGLHFRRGIRLHDDNVQMSGVAFCVGGGSSTGYICHVYGQCGVIWLASDDNTEDLFEIDYDCGCDTETGIFPGYLIVSCADLVDAVKFFFQTEKMADWFHWIPEAELGFDPWRRE